MHEEVAGGARADGPARDRDRVVESGTTATRRLPVAGLLVAAWAVLPPYVGPALATEPRVEVVDHVVPGLVVLAVSAGALVAGARPAQTGVGMFAAGLAVVLAGFWMTATHVPLLAQAARAEAPVGAAVYHTLPGLAVVAVGVAWAVRHGRE